MTRWFIQSRVRAPSYPEAVWAFYQATERQGYTVIRVGCHPTHLPGEWEGVVEIEEPKNGGDNFGSC